MNHEKHVKTPAEQLADAENSLVPTHARGRRFVDRYIKARRVGRGKNRAASAPAPTPICLRFDQVETTSVALARIRRRVREINRQLGLSNAPFRLRMM
jgi:hypothetical protein